jgi:ornithine decarboxylase
MKEIQINMSDLGFGANRIGIIHGYQNIVNHYPKLAQKINYISYDIQKENFLEYNKKFYNTVYHACENIYHANLKTLQDNKFPILLGGDHALALGSIKATLEYYQPEDIGLIWIDAHTDINTFEITESGHIHGMPVSGLLGINDDKYNNLGNKLRIKPENLVYFATRDIDYGEAVLVNKYHLLNFTDMKIKADSLENKIKETIYYLKDKVKKIHISLDLDSMNPEAIKGVSTPVKGGLSIDQPMQIINELSKYFEIVSLDIVEYNPLEDTDEKTITYINDFVNEFKI